MKKYLQYIKEITTFEIPPNRLKILDDMKFDKIKGDAILNFEFHFIDKQNPRITYDIRMIKDDETVYRFLIDKIKGNDEAEINQFYNDDANQVYYFILENLVKNIDKVTKFIDNINRVEQIILTSDKVVLKIMHKKCMYGTMLRLRDDVEKSYEYQKYLFDKGEIDKLVKIKELQPGIEDKLKDVKKQSEWN